MFYLGVRTISRKKQFWFVEIMICLSAFACFSCVYPFIVTCSSLSILPVNPWSTLLLSFDWFTAMCFILDFQFSTLLFVLNAVAHLMTSQWLLFHHLGFHAEHPASRWVYKLIISSTALRSSTLSYLTELFVPPFPTSLHHLLHLIDCMILCMYSSCWTSGWNKI